MGSCWGVIASVWLHALPEKKRDFEIPAAWNGTIEWITGSHHLYVASSTTRKKVDLEEPVRQNGDYIKVSDACAMLFINALIHPREMQMGHWRGVAVGDSGIEMTIIPWPK